eukprot:Amastigsp_a175054_37.p2 type:complete len:118 gc:universal Amastigsp_a175054_37:403-50(-)
MDDCGRLDCLERLMCACLRVRRAVQLPWQLSALPLSSSFCVPGLALVPGQSRAGIGDGRSVVASSDAYAHCLFPPPPSAHTHGDSGHTAQCTQTQTHTHTSICLQGQTSPQSPDGAH